MRIALPTTPLSAAVLPGDDPGQRGGAALVARLRLQLDQLRGGVPVRALLPRTTCPRHGRLGRRPRWRSTVVGFVVGDGAHGPSDIFFAMAFVGTPWAAGVAVRLRREREAMLHRPQRGAARTQEENERRAVAAERARIARELHDVVSHAISVTVLQARGGRKMVGRDDEAVRRALDAIEQTNTAALGDMRRLLAVLRDTEDRRRTRVRPAAVAWPASRGCVEQVRASGLHVDLPISGRAGPVPPGVDLSAYRIVQEALTNVLKHAGPGARHGARCTTARTTWTSRSATTAARASSGDRGRRHGLVGIRERVAVVGGSVEAGPVDGGFAVRARLPYSVTAAADDPGRARRRPAAGAHRACG